MNLELLNPFELDYPDFIEDCLDDTEYGSMITICRFNSDGTYIAAGCSDGRCFILDFQTRNIARSLIAHASEITALSWSSTGRYLLTAGKDWSTIVWDVGTGTKMVTIATAGPIMSAQLHPKDESIVLYSVLCQSPVLYNIKTDEKQHINLEKEDVQSASKATSFVYSCFSRNGNFIFLGMPKGQLRILSYPSLDVIHDFPVTNAPIRQIELSENNCFMILNSNDRIIRLYNIENLHERVPQLIHKFQDSVNRIQWNAIQFSPDGEFVAGGSSLTHKIYLWDRGVGNLTKILEGPKEPVEYISWHPYRPFIATVSSFGLIYIWAKTLSQNWSAYAPDFKEIEGNVEYEEREDEFDKNTRDRSVTENVEIEETEIVDITGTDNQRIPQCFSIPIQISDFAAEDAEEGAESQEEPPMNPEQNTTPMPSMMENYESISASPSTPPVKKKKKNKSSKRKKDKKEEEFIDIEGL